MQRLVEFEKVPHALRIRLTDAGRKAINETSLLSVPTNTALQELFEWQLCNGWEWIAPEEIGALTAAPILSDDARRDDSGTLTDVGIVYWHERYQIEDPVRELYVEGFVDFSAASGHTAEAKPSPSG